MLPNSEVGSAVVARPAVAIAEPVKSVVEAAKTSTSLPEQQAPDDAGQPEAAVAKKGISDPDKARPVLEILTETINPVQVSETGKVEQRFDKTQLAEDVVNLKASKNPLSKAAGFDLEIALIQSDLATVDQRMAKAKQKVATSVIEAHKRQQNRQLEQLRAERDQIKGVDGKPIESQLGKLTASLTEKGTEAEKKLAQDNPLGLIEKKFNEAAKDKTVRTGLFDSIRSASGASLTAEDKATLEEQIKIMGETMDSVSSDNQKTKAKEIKGKLFKMGGLAALLPILMAWLASKKNQGGGGQG